MAKMYTVVGYVETVETERGIHETQVTTRECVVDVLRLSKSWESSKDGVNDNINVNNEFSMLADPYALAHFHSMKFINLWGTPWEIKSVAVEYPRLKLSVGGVYNGDTNGSST